MTSSASMNDPSLSSSTCSKIRRRQSLKAKLMSRTLTPNSELDQGVVDERVDGPQRALAGAVEAVGGDDVDLVLAQQPHRAGQLRMSNGRSASV